jgi:two-component system response regulator NreC
MALRVLIVDDHPVLRSGLKNILALLPEVEVAGEAASAAEALRQAARLRPGLVLLDLTLPDRNGLVVLRQLHAQWPEMRILVLTMHDEEDYVKEAFAAGASGYVLKQAADTELVSAVRAVARGELYVYPSVTRYLVQGLVRSESGEGAENTDGLSFREREVLRRLALGFTHAEIAEELAISVKSVETYRRRVFPDSAAPFP